MNVSGDNLSTIDILNSMVKQVPGVTWLVLYDDGVDTDGIGYMCGDGSNTRVSVTFR